MQLFELFFGISVSNRIQRFFCASRFSFEKIIDNHESTEKGTCLIIDGKWLDSLCM